MTATAPDPVSFLRVTLAEVRARAEAAEKDAPSPWRTNGGLVEHSGQEDDSEDAPWYNRAGALWYSEGCTSGRICMTDEVAAFVVQFDPATVLRMVAATEKLLELHRETTSETPCDSRDCCAGPHKVIHCEECGHVTDEDGPCSTVEGLARMWGWTDDE